MNQVKTLAQRVKKGKHDNKHPKESMLGDQHRSLSHVMSNYKEFDSRYVIMSSSDSKYF